MGEVERAPGGEPGRQEPALVDAWLDGLVLHAEAGADGDRRGDIRIGHVLRSGQHVRHAGVRSRIGQHDGRRGADVAGVDERVAARAHRGGQDAVAANRVGRPQQVLHVEVRLQEREARAAPPHQLVDLLVLSHEGDRRGRRGTDRREPDDVRHAGPAGVVQHPAVLRGGVGAIPAGEQHRLDAFHRASERRVVLEAPLHDLGAGKACARRISHQRPNLQSRQ